MNKKLSASKKGKGQEAKGENNDVSDNTFAFRLPRLSAFVVTMVI
jgi:hypothetical protein